MALSATTRRFSFRGVHSLNTGAHKEQCHGHQYLLEVSFSRGTLSEVETEVNAKIICALDGHDLTHILDRPATGEVLVEWIHERLLGGPLKDKILGVALQETRKNRFVSARSDARLI